MGVLPLQFQAGESAAKLGLTGEEVFDIDGLAEGIASGFTKGRQVRVKAMSADGKVREFQATVRIDTPQEVLYYQHGGILQYVLRQLLAQR
jgi:aconitate hydratase